LIKDKCIQMVDIFNFQIGTDTWDSFSRLHVKDSKPIAEKNEKKLVVWRWGTMSIAGRTTLISSSLSSAIIYHMFVYLLPKTTTDELDKQRQVFFRQGGVLKRSTNW
jgi:hypothetical protein